MVGHQNIGTNLPMRGRAPDLDERSVDVWICQPWTTGGGTYSKEDQGWGAVVFNDTLSRVSYLRQHV